LELFEPQPQTESSGLLFASRMAEKTTNSDDTSVMIDSWSPAVQCYGICLDINWDNFVNETDFLVVVGECGSDATGDLACLEGVFSTDGTVDTFDVASWDWALNSEDRLLNFCGVPLTGEDEGIVGAALGSLEGSGQPLPLANLPENLSDLLIAGKRDDSNAANKLKDRLYTFDDSGLSGELFESEPDRGNIGLVQGPNGELYQLNSETGLLRLDNNNEVIVPPGEVELTDITEPRYNKPATVYIGIQDEGPDSFGRPILDAVFDANYVYVVPVVVHPENSEPYTAAAKLNLLDEANPPYEVVELYDDPPLPNDNQYRDHLREIELDSAGNLYVLNVHSYNESDILWRYYPDGTVERIDLGRPDSDNYIPAPIGMYASKTTDMLYLTSTLDNPEDSNSTVIYGFSTKNALTIERTVTIDGMHHVSGITENPQTGSVWVAGFNMYDVPQYPNPTQPAFYYPHLAKIPYGSNDVQLIPLYDPDAHDLALPMSVIWTGTAICGGADLDDSGEVSFGDFSILAEHWLDTNCASPEWCDSADVDKSYTVDMADLAILTENWLQSGCLD
jgi:hypothetical protein